MRPPRREERRRTDLKKKYVDNDNEVALKTYEKLGMGSHYKVMEDMF